MKYILGIDFGDGETVAAYTDITDPSGVIKYANIKQANTAEGKKIISLVMKGQDSKYGISLERGKLLLSFKGKIRPGLDNLPEDTYDSDRSQYEKQQAFGAFIRDVVALIKKHHSDEMFRDEKEVTLYIAAPTKWTDEDKLNYKEFVKGVTGLDVGWVINESDAAFFAKKVSVASDGVVLVIDYGSSTIDFTLMVDGHKKDIDNMSTDFAANEIEEIILLDYKKNPRTKPEYERLITKANASLMDKGNSFVDIDTCLKLSIRKAKEGAYTEVSSNLTKYPRMYITGNWRLSKDTGSDEDRDIKFEYDFKESDLASYKDKFRQHLKKLKKKILEIESRPLDCVILTGGASIMPWVRDIVQETWNSSEEIGGDTHSVKILNDSCPSYVVATGIVEYAKKLYQCPAEIVELFDRMLEDTAEDCSYLTNKDFLKTKIESEINRQIDRIINNELNGVLDKYKESDEEHSSYSKLRDAISEFLQTECSRPEVVDEIKQTVRAFLNEYFSDRMNAVLIKHYGTSDVVCNVDIQSLSIIIDKNGIESYISAISPRTCPTMNKSRNREERAIIVDKIRQKKNLKITGKLASEEAFDSIISQARDSLRKWAETDAAPFFLVR